MKFSALIAVAAAHGISDEVEQMYIQHISEHGKSYGTTEEYKFRLAIFAKNAQFVDLHNQVNQGPDAHKVALNHMADWTEYEYKRLLGFRGQQQTEQKAPQPVVAGAPASVDWRAKGAVTPVKNQGQCGSCWSFSTTGSVEGRYQIAGNTLTSFSEQQLCDCSRSFGNNGCNGGLMDYAFKYL